MDIFWKLHIHITAIMIFSTVINSSKVPLPKIPTTYYGDGTLIVRSRDITTTKWEMLTGRQEFGVILDPKKPQASKQVFNNTFTVYLKGEVIASGWLWNLTDTNKKSSWSIQKTEGREYKCIKGPAARVIPIGYMLKHLNYTATYKFKERLADVWEETKDFDDNYSIYFYRVDPVTQLNLPAMSRSFTLTTDSRLFFETFVPRAGPNSLFALPKNCESVSFDYNDNMPEDVKYIGRQIQDNTAEVLFGMRNKMHVWPTIHNLDE